MRSKFKVMLLSIALMGTIVSSTACDEYLYGLDVIFVGVDRYPGAFGGFYYYDDDYDDDDYFDDLEDFWDDLEDDWDDFFDD